MLIENSAMRPTSRSDWIPSPIATSSCPHEDDGYQRQRSCHDEDVIEPAEEQIAPSARSMRCVYSFLAHFMHA
jgi:hypothetical protein